VTPERCADVKCREDHNPAWWEAEVGDELWNPKAGEGHVIVAEVPCDEGRTADCGCGGWLSQRCTSTTLVCECGEDNSWRDHHYELLAPCPACPTP
jgi:hypothetical protein